MSDLNNNRIKRQASKNVAATSGNANRALIKGTHAVSVQAHPDSFQSTFKMSLQPKTSVSKQPCAACCWIGALLPNIWSHFPQPIVWKTHCYYLCKHARLNPVGPVRCFLMLHSCDSLTFTLHAHQRLRHLSQLFCSTSPGICWIFASLILTIDGPNFPSHLSNVASLPPPVWCVGARA